jgi:ribosome-binding protein aMBF1 (putative translation factor)
MTSKKPTMRKKITMTKERQYRKTVRAIGKKKTHDGLTFRADFPQWLKDTIKSKGITQRDLAKEMGICETLVSRWVKGERFPHVVHVLGLAGFFDVSTDEILGIK